LVTLIWLKIKIYYDTRRSKGIFLCWVWFRYGTWSNPSILLTCSKLEANPSLTRIFFDMTRQLNWGEKIKNLGFLGKIFQIQNRATKNDPNWVKNFWYGPITSQISTFDSCWFHPAQSCSRVLNRECENIIFKIHVSKLSLTKKVSENWPRPDKKILNFS